MRRANGSGSVYKLSGKRRHPWAVVAPMEYDDDGHAERRIIGYAATRTDAEKMLVEYLDRPYDVDSANRTTFGELYEMWITRAEKDRTESTMETYALAKKRLQPLMGQKIRDLKYTDFERIFDGMRNLSFSSRRQTKSVIAQVYALAERLEIVTKNPAAAVDIGKPDKSDKHKIFEVEEIKRLYDNRGEQNAANALILIYTGLRPKEAIIQPITEDDIARGWFVAIGVKNDQSKGRIIPIHPAIAPILAGRKWLIEGKRQEHTPLSYKRLYDSMHESFAHLPHDGRHTCATMMKQYHVDEYARKRILGHTGGNVTDDFYTHLSPEYFCHEFAKVPSPPDL